LRATQYNQPKKTAAVSTANPQIIANSCHVQFAQPYIQLQVIVSFFTKKE
jgi:hypothetical protein